MIISLIILLSITLIVVSIILIKALEPKSKKLDFELNITLKSFNLKFKTKENSTPSHQD
ncbi:MAG: hypothetical protein ACRC7R_02135 [Sarcina sp.]